MQDSSKERPCINYFQNSIFDDSAPEERRRAAIIPALTQLSCGAEVVTAAARQFAKRHASARGGKARRERTRIREPRESAQTQNERWRKKCQFKGAHRHENEEYLKSFISEVG